VSIFFFSKSIPCIGEEKQWIDFLENFQVFKMEPNMTFFVKDPRDKGISFSQGEEISCTVIYTATDDDGNIEEFIAGLIQKA